MNERNSVHDLEQQIASIRPSPKPRAMADLVQELRESAERQRNEVDSLCTQLEAYFEQLRTQIG